MQALLLCKNGVSDSYTYYLEKYTQICVRLSTVGSILLQVFRRPVWTYKVENARWRDLGYYPSFGIATLSDWICFPLSLLLMTVTSVSLHKILYNERISAKIPESRKKILARVALPLVGTKLFLDAIQFVIFIYSGRTWWSLSPLEAIIMIIAEPCFESKLYHTMYRSLSYFGGLMFLFACVVVSWTILEMTLIQGIREVPSVSVLDESVWDMLMILNTANWPTPIIAFYEKATVNFTYFIAYSVVVDWGFLNLVLGLIVAFFEDAFMGDEVVEEEAAGAAHALDGEEEGGEGGFIHASAARTHTAPGESDRAFVAESSAAGAIEEAGVRNPLAAAAPAPATPKIEPMQIEEPTSSSLQQATGIRGWWRAKMKTLHPYVEHRYFNLFCDLVLFVLGFNFLFGASPRSILTAQIALNSVELIIRVLVRKGTLTHFFVDARHVSNTVFIVVLVSTSVAYFSMCGATARTGDVRSPYTTLADSPVCGNDALQSKISPSMDGHVVFTIILIRTCILVRISLVTRNFGWDYIPVAWQQQLTRASAIIGETSKALAHLVIMLLTIMYIYASLGTHLFGGLLSKNSDLPGYAALVSSEYATSGYWPLNFNDMASGFTTMFTLLYINNMQLVTAGCVAVTSMWAEVFFGSFYVVGVLYVRNIFTSFLWSRIGKILDPDANPIENAAPREELRVDSIGRMSAIGSMVLDSQTLVGSGKHGGDNGTSRASEARLSHVSRASVAEPHRRLEHKQSITFMSTLMAGTQGNVAFNGQEEGDALKTQVLDNLQSTVATEDIKISEYMAVIILNAKYGLILQPFKERISLWAFKLRSAMFRWVLLSCWGLTFLRVFQTPPWMIELDKTEMLMERYWFSGVGFMSANLTTGLKVPLLLSLQFMLILEVISKKDMVKVGYAHIARYVMIGISFTSTITLLVSLTGNKAARRVDWYLSFFSVMYTFWFDRTAMKRLFIVLGVLPKLVVLMFVLGIFVSVVAVFADLLFDPAHLDHGDDDYNARYYRNYFQSVWTIFVAITSSSYPNQFMPAMRAYREFALYFISIISIGGFLILEGAIAVVNTAYQGGVAVVKQAENKTKEKAVSYVFDIFSSVNQKVKIEKATGARVSVNLGKEIVTASQFDKLAQELFLNYGEFRLIGKHGPEERAILRTIMDVNGDGKLCTDDFSMFYDVARIKIKRVPDDFMTKKEKAASKDERSEMRMVLARSSTGWSKAGATLRLLRVKYSKCFKDAMNTSPLRCFSKKHWDMLADSVTGMMGIVCVLSKSSKASHELVAWGMVFFMLVEFLCKWFLGGILSYFRNMRNKIDFSIMWLLIVVLAVGTARQEIFEETSNFTKMQRMTSVLLDITTMLRLFLYPRNIAIFSSPVNGVKWSSVLGTIAALSFAFAEAFICLGFTYAQLGVLFYGGVIPREGINAALDKSPFGQNNFYILSFNDMPSAFFTLFCCLRVSDWDVVAQGVVTMTGKMISTRIFFSMWYLLGVVLMLNILKSYFVIVFRSKPQEKPEEPRDEFGIPLDGAEKETLQQSMADSIAVKKNKEEARALRKLAQEEMEIPSDDDISDDEGGFDELELLNIAGGFVVDLGDMAERRDFVGLNEAFLPLVRKARDEEAVRMRSTKQNEDEAGKSNRYRYNIKLPFKQGMEAADRAPILRRMQELSIMDTK